MKYYDVYNKRLLFFHKKTHINFWEELWDQLLIKKDLIYIPNQNSIVCKYTPRYIKPNNGTILEGGCGLGQYVYNLTLMDYDAVGIDNAEKIVRKVNRENPSLKIKVGDVRKLPFSDDSITGYWSLGVIEHFFNGYDEILKEMRRVIKKKGYLFITFPYMSSIRKFKSKINLYRIFNSKYYDKNIIPERFYQYAFDSRKIINDLEKLGFKLILLVPYDGIKGLKDEIFFYKFFIRKFLQILYNSYKSRFIGLIKSVLEKVLSKYFGHTVLLILQKIQ